MQDANLAVKWYTDAQARGATYSMVNRNGPNSYDCSSALYYALKQGRYLPASTPIGNTDSLFRDLEANGWEAIQPDANGNFPTQRGDACIWGHRGASSGALGHAMLFVNENDVIHMNSYYNGIHVNNYDFLAGANGWPEATFYRYTGNSIAPSTNAVDQILEVGSWIKFSKVYAVNDVQQVNGDWQIRTDELCSTNFTWDDNGIPAGPLTEVDAQGYATIDQDLAIGSSYVVPGKYQILDLGQDGDMWLGLLEFNGERFWVEIDTLTEVAGDDPGYPMPGVAPSTTPTPPAEPITPVATPEPPVELPPTTPVETPIEPSEPTAPTEPINTPKENTMAFSDADQKALAIATKSAQDEANLIAADQGVQEITGSISPRTKLMVYLIGDSLIGLAIVIPGLAVSFNFGTLIQVQAFAGVLAAAGGFVLTMFGIYKSSK